MSVYESLKPGHQAFVDHYVANAHAPNPTAAMRAARPDYKRPDVHASKLMAKPEILAAIEERLTRRRELSELDEKWVLDRLRCVAERCMQAEPVLREGEPTGEYRFDSSGANRALELIGKHFAMFTEKINHSGDFKHRHVHELSDAALAAIAAGNQPENP